MKAFLLGTAIGGLAVWRWRNDIARFFDQGREGAVKALETGRKKADAVIDRAKQGIESTQRTTPSAHSEGGSATSQGGSGAALGQPRPNPESPRRAGSAS